MSVGVSPLTDGVPGRARNGGWPGGLAATGYVAKYASNEWFSWKITTRCLIGVFAGGAPKAVEAPSSMQSTNAHRDIVVTPSSR